MRTEEIMNTTVDIESARARVEWNGAVRHIAGNRQIWQVAALIEAVAVIICIFGLIHLGSLPHEIPYVIGTDKDGNATYLGQPKQMLKADWDTVALAAMKRFIVNWRTVTSDQRAQIEMHDNAFAYIGNHSPAYKWLEQWYVKNDPLPRAARGETTSIHFTTHDWSGDNTIGLWFEETTYTMQGEAVKKTYRSRMTYASRVPASNEAQKSENPLGFAITELGTEEVN